jgi:hypothetical protein
MIQNTKSEAKKFGLVYPSDPQLWSYSMSTINQFVNAMRLTEKKKIAVIALSGERRRITMMNNLKEILILRGWKVKSTDHSLDWRAYINLIKSSQITATTCWLHKIHINGSIKNRSRLPDTSLTGRVFEGFASSSAVFTTPSSVLDFLGFKAGTHYILIPNEFEKELLEFTIPDTFELESIGKAGHDHYLQIKYS